MELKTGLTYTATTVVNNDNIASRYGSGLVAVFATPAMVALMENAAMNAVLSHLPHGNNTVGVEVSVSHTKATPMGMTVNATAVLKEIDGKKLTFDVVASDEEGEIGRSTHTRFVIDVERFMSKLTKKSNQ